jgi:hypothetical protein
MHYVYCFGVYKVRAKHYRNYQKILQNYSLEYVLTTLPQYYNKVNTMVDYCGVE